MSEWISVKDSLPKLMTNKVLVCCKNGYVGFGHYENYRGTKTWYNLESQKPFSAWNYGDDDYEVTYWRELPDPPETNLKRLKIKQQIIAERKNVFDLNELEMQIERLLEIRQKLFKQIGKMLEEEPGKSYEGEFSISMNYPNYYEDEDCKMNKPYLWTIHLDCYVVGPHRHYDWSGKTLKEAIDKCESDIDNWINGAFRWKE